MAHSAELGEDESEFDSAVRFREVPSPLQCVECSRSLAEISECRPTQPQQPRQQLDDVQRLGALGCLGCKHACLLGPPCLERRPGEGRIRLDNLRRFPEF